MPREKKNDFNENVFIFVVLNHKALKIFSLRTVNWRESRKSLVVWALTTALLYDNSSQKFNYLMMFF